MSQRIRLSVTRLLDVAGRLGGLPEGQRRGVGEVLLAGATEAFDPRAASRLNNDGSPLQFSLSSTPDGVHRRVIADPCAGTTDRAAQRARADAALRRVLGAKAPELAAAGLDTLDAVVPRPSRSIGGVTLEDFDSGVLWIGAAASGPGAAFYVDVRPHGRSSFDLVRSWLAGLLPDGAAAAATVEGLREAGDLASIGLEGYRRADARAKVYLRLQEADLPLAALGVPLLDSGEVRSFLAEVLGPHGIHREGLLLGVGFRLAGGALADAKVDVCGHCLPYSPPEWAGVVRRATRRFGLSEPPVEAVTADGSCEVAFLGLGLDTGGRVRVNTYLKSDPSGGPVTAERLRAALADGVAGLVALQYDDGSWQDYDLPVGASDQWVTAYVGHALAAVSGRLDGPAARMAAAAAGRAADALDRRRYGAGWGYNATTGPDCDSTAFALNLRAALGRDVAPADRAFLAAHWRGGGGFATFQRAGGWGVAHPDVTPLAFAALTPAEQQARAGQLETFLRRTRGPDGLWPSYWWRAPYYATYRVLRLLADLPPGTVALPPPSAPARLEPRDTFELACVLGIDTLQAGAGSPGEPALTAALLARQGLDGRWPGSENLRVTDEQVLAGAPGAAGHCYADRDGTITTATALEVLAQVPAPDPGAVAAHLHNPPRKARDASLVP